MVYPRRNWPEAVPEEEPAAEAAETCTALVPVESEPVVVIEDNDPAVEYAVADAMAVFMGDAPGDEDVKIYRPGVRAIGPAPEPEYEEDYDDDWRPSWPRRICSLILTVCILVFFGFTVRLYFHIIDDIKSSKPFETVSVNSDGTWSVVTGLNTSGGTYEIQITGANGWYNPETGDAESLDGVWEVAQKDFQRAHVDAEVRFEGRVYPSGDRKVVELFVRAPGVVKGIVLGDDETSRVVITCSDGRETEDRTYLIPTRLLKDLELGDEILWEELPGDSMAMIQSIECVK